MRTFLSLGLLASLLFSAASARAEPWHADTANSSVAFAVRHLLINDVRGRFARFTASLELDGDVPDVSSVRVAIDAASVDTGHDGRDSHLRGPDFFAADAHPEIVFEATTLEWRDGELLATGPLALHGVTREVTIPLTITAAVRDPWGNERRGVQAAFQLNRRDWDMTWSETLDGGGLVVGDDVRVTASLELVRGK